jgi:hypothetical protein
MLRIAFNLSMPHLSSIAFDGTFTRARCGLQPKSFMLVILTYSSWSKHVPKKRDDRSKKYNKKKR